MKDYKRFQELDNVTYESFVPSVIPSPTFKVVAGELAEGVTVHEDDEYYSNDYEWCFVKCTCPSAERPGKYTVSVKDPDLEAVNNVSFYCETDSSYFIFGETERLVGVKSNGKTGEYTINVTST